MVRPSLIFRYQWRAFWRRVLRTGRLKFYLTSLTLLGLAAVALPDSLSRAASELATGQTAAMERLLLVVCLLWLAVLCEDLNVSVNSDRLRRFPVDLRSLLALKLLSLVLSPLVWLATIVSLLTLYPFLSARHPLLGSVAALIFFALTIGVGMTVSQLRAVDRRNRRLFVAVAVLGGVVLAFAFALGPTRAGGRPLVPPLMAANPATLVTDIAVATAPLAIAIPIALLLVGSAAVWYLVRWSFLRSVYRETSDRAARRETSLAGLPGRLGPLIQKEQRSMRRTLDIWMALLPVLAGAAISFSVSLSSTVRQAIIVMVCALNANVMQNCLGLDRPAGLTRYLILPIRGKDLFFAKNMAVILVVTVQLTLLFAIGAWQSGVMQLGAEILVASVMLLTHLAWGNIVSVFEPRRAEPHRFAPAADPVTAMISLLIGSTPGVAVIVLLRSDSPVTTWAIAVIVLLTMGAYYGSLRFAGSSFERRIERISRRLA